MWKQGRRSGLAVAEIKTSMATIHDAEIKLVQSELNMNLLKDVSDIV